MNRSINLIVEALLFAAEKPLSPSDIASFLGEASVKNVSLALKELQAEYESMERSFIIREVAKGYQFRTKSEYGSYILKMFKKSSTRLSRAAMETLAIIAYKQPILRQEVERIRGVDVGGIIRTLLEKNLIRIVGRKNLPGRPLIYGTTKKFLEVFDLKDLKSLPKLKEIKALGSDDAETEASPEENNSENAPQKEDPAPLPVSGPIE